jgi:hypothetical protein
MRPLLASLIVLLAGCEFVPLGLEDARPVFEDAPLNHDIVLFGEAEFSYGYVNNNGGLTIDCRIEAEVEGWKIEDLEPSATPCDDCAIAFEMVFSEVQTVEGGCDEPIRGAASIAVMPMEYLPTTFSDAARERYQTWQPDGTDGPAVQIASTNWHPSGSQDWDVELAVFDPANPSDEDWAWQFYARTPYYSRLASGDYADWAVNLRLWDP